MQNVRCSKCGGESAPVTPCPDCGPASVNGSAKNSRVKPPPPPELVSRVFTPTPPVMLEQMRREFDEAEWLAAARETERTGGVTFEEIMAEIERKLHGRN